MRVAVTGGHGFIGQVVCEELAEQCHEAVPVDRVNGYDVREPVDMHEALRGCDAVIHLAGVLGTSELFDNPHVAVQVNVVGTLNVLRSCERFGLRYVGITMPEAFPSLYTATKMGARALEECYRISAGVPVSRVRAYNAYGAGQAYGPGHPQKIIPTFAVYAWNNEPIPIWGNGLQTVDLVHVSDVAALLVRALAHGGGQTFDAGSGNAMSVNDVARFVIDVTGSEGGVRHRPMRRGEVATQLVADLSTQVLLGGPFAAVDRLEETVLAYKAHPACVLPL